MIRVNRNNIVTKKSKPKKNYQAEIFVKTAICIRFDWYLGQTVAEGPLRSCYGRLAKFSMYEFNMAAANLIWGTWRTKNDSHQIWYTEIFVVSEHKTEVGFAKFIIAEPFMELCLGLQFFVHVHSTITKLSS